MKRTQPSLFSSRVGIFSPFAWLGLIIGFGCSAATGFGQAAAAKPLAETATEADRGVFPAEGVIVIGIGLRELRITPSAAAVEAMVRSCGGGSGPPATVVTPRLRHAKRNLPGLFLQGDEVSGR